MSRAVKVAECAAMYYHRGRLIWDDYLHHRQFELTADAEALCRSFARFTDLDSALAPLPPGDAAAVQTLIDELIAGGVLIEEGSPAHAAEQELLAAWESWGHSTWQYHFASRTLADATYASHDEQEAELDAKLASGAPPSPFRRVGDNPPITLPQPRLGPAATIEADSLAGDHPGPARTSTAAAEESGAGNGIAAPWAARPLLDVLLARHTTREFSREPVELADLAALLRVVAGPSPIRPGSDRSATVFKLTPSAGGRHPIEVYVHASRVSGLPAGWYHYAAADHLLEPLGEPWPADRLAAAAGDQDWIGSAAVVLCYVAVLDRVRWKYDTTRTYRMLQMDVGHLSQTTYLVATAMGLGVGFSAALRDELLERELGCDPNRDIVLGLTALGHAV